MRQLMIWVLLTLLCCNSVLAKTEEAIFAGGCFWCVEADFDKIPGVLSTIVGFDGGALKNPTYEMVASGKTNYAESVRITFDPKVVNYQQLVEYFWHHSDPTVKNAQFCDHGRQYRNAIFYLNKKQRQIAEQSKKDLAQKFSEIYTEIVPTTQFYPAAKNHQDYYHKNPLRYKFYRYRCGRDKRIEEIWGGSN